MTDSRADYPWVVVGAGVVGAAVAAELGRRLGPGLLIERWERPAQETTSRNSGVLHAGIHHPSEWLKARACVEGRRIIYDLAGSHEIPLSRCGKLIVAQDAEEEGRLETILERGRDNGVEGLRILTGDELHRLEPRVRGCAALLSPESGIVDPHGLTDFFMFGVREVGSDLAFGTRLTAAERITAGYRLALEDEDAPGEAVSLTAERVVNSAGLEADRVAALFGIDVKAAGYELTWAKGNYWSLGGGFEGGIERLVYPVPPKDRSGLGIHLTLDLGGGLRLGPDVEWLDERVQDYQVGESGHTRFFEAASRYLPGLERTHLAPDMAGIRPKLSGQGEPMRDFVVREESDRGLPGLVDMVGIESPGLTASPALALLVADLLC